MIGIVFIQIAMISVIGLSQDVKFKDGSIAGKRSSILAQCIKNADSKLMEIKGVQVETDKYCACICDELFPNINSWDLEKAHKENKIFDLMFSGENLNIIMNCLEGNREIDENFTYAANKDVEMSGTLEIKICALEIMRDPELSAEWTREMAETYCECVYNKAVELGYTYAQIIKSDDENSEIFNETVLPCVLSVTNFEQGLQAAAPTQYEDVIGDQEFSKIPLTDFLGNEYKLKLTISGISKYYTFDTGAVDIIIDKNTEAELIESGGLKPENYVGSIEYTLANNQIVTGQKAIVESITIGDFIVQNVEIGIIENGKLLCGRSILNKFRKWEIDKEKNELILYK